MKKSSVLIFLLFGCLALFGFSTKVSSDVTVYRLYNPNAKAGAHHYTPHAYERDQLVRVGWRSEGIGFYAASLK